MPLPPRRWCCLTSVCLSVAYIGPKSRTERPRKIKIGTEVAHVTPDSDTTFKVCLSRSRSPGRFRWLYRQANMDIELVTDPDACMIYHVTTCRPGRGHIPAAYNLFDDPVSWYITVLVGVYTFRSSDRPVGPTGLSDWSVRRSYRVNASSDRRTDGRRIKHVWFRPTADPTVEACGHYVRLVGPTGQQTCSQVLTVRVQVQVQVLASQVQVQVQVLASQVQVQEQVLNLRVQVQVQVRDSMSQPVFLVISKKFQL